MAASESPVRRADRVLILVIAAAVVIFGGISLYIFGAPHSSTDVVITQVALIQATTRAAPTFTPTNTATATATPTSTATSTPTNTPTNTPTATFTATATLTNTTTATATATATNTATITPSFTATSTPTDTASPTTVLSVTPTTLARQVDPVDTPVPRINMTVTDRMPSFGPKDAKIVFVEFGDFECPYCERFTTQTLPKIKQTYGDKIRFVFRHMPLSQIHPHAMMAALAAECAHEQDKFWQYHDLLFENQEALERANLIAYASKAGVAKIDQFTQCLDSAKYKDMVQADYDAAVKYDINGTPTFFINGIPILGAQDYSVFASVIDQELKAVGK